MVTCIERGLASDMRDDFLETLKLGGLAALSAIVVATSVIVVGESYLRAVARDELGSERPRVGQSSNVEAAR